MQIMPQTFKKISKFGEIKINDPMNLIYSYIYEDEFFNVGLNGVYDVNENSDVVNF